MHAATAIRAEKSRMRTAVHTMDQKCLRLSNFPLVYLYREEEEEI